MRVTFDTFVPLVVITFALSASATNQKRTLSDLPIDAHASISAILGKELPEYHMHSLGGGLKAVIPQQNLKTDFSPNAVLIQAGNTQLQMRLLSPGVAHALKNADLQGPHTASNRVEYHYGQLTESYVNGPVGLEQRFDISRRPVHGPREALTLTLALSSTAPVRLNADHTGLLFGTAEEESPLRYTELTAHDADGNELPISLDLRGQQLLLNIVDKSARYPVVVSGFFEAQLTHKAQDGPDEFGTAMAATDDIVVVGAFVANIGSNKEQGAAYLFVKPAGGWRSMTQTAKLLASDGTQYSYFGCSVAISGDTVVVGAYEAIGGLQYPGAVYVYTKPAPGWAGVITESAKLYVSGLPSGAYLGFSVAISGDTIATAAIEDNNEEGVVYVFVKSGNTWKSTSTPDARLASSDGVNQDYMGSSLSIDGDTIVAGAPNATYILGFGPGPGKAYVFSKPPGGWTNMTQTARLVASDGTYGDMLGFSVSVSANTIAAGAYHAAIGSNQSQGAAYIFIKPVNGWVDMSEAAKLTASDSKAQDMFGYSVSIRKTIILVGATGVNNYQGKAYIFVEPADGWTTTSQYQAKLKGDGSRFGTTACVNSKTVALTTFSAGNGAAYVFGFE